MKTFKLFSTVLLTALIFTACEQTDNVSECDIDGAVCTTEFITVTMSLKTSSGTPITLDSIVVTKNENGDGIYSKQTGEISNGIFPVITDSEMGKIVKEGSLVNFKGYSSGIEIVNEEYKVGHDCCHVKFIQGTQNVILSTESR
jgi:hypothetical protein